MQATQAVPRLSASVSNYQCVRFLFLNPAFSLGQKQIDGFFSWKAITEIRVCQLQSRDSKRLTLQVVMLYSVVRKGSKPDNTMIKPDCDFMEFSKLALI